MSDIDIRIVGRAGRITLNRPKALNALTYAMCLDIETALDRWRDDPEVALVVIDAMGDKAFCAGGDIQEMYDTGSAGDFDYGRRFWADEYRLNAKIANYPKPYVALMQGFTMGGGVGVSCHGSHRIVGESSQIAMPECGIGLVPDVGGSLILARAPGHLGEYFGTTAARMGAADAIYVGFADHFVPEARWPALTTVLEQTGDAAEVAEFVETTPAGKLAHQQSEIDALFAGENLAAIEKALMAAETEFATAALKSLRRNSPLSTAVAIEMIRRLRDKADIHDALDMEYRYTYRSMEHGDFLEGIRAAIIDKDRNPKWRHASIHDVPDQDVARMLAPLGANSLNLKEQPA